MSSRRGIIPLMFQLTRPWEGATAFLGANMPPAVVSTHAPVGGRDRMTIIH